MSISRIFAIAHRIVRQFKHDKRTLALLFIVPIVVISLLGPLLNSSPDFEIGIANVDRAYTPPVPASAIPRPGEAPQAQQQVQPLPKLKPVKLSDKVIDELKKADNVSVSEIKSKEITELLRDGRIVVALRFSEDFSKSLISGNSPKMELTVDGSDPSRAQAAVAIIQKALAGQAKGIAKPSLKVDYQYGGEEFGTLDYFAPVFIAFFAFFFVFLLTSVSFLRERGQGTIERLMSSPVRRLEVILGYELGFILFATIQVAIIMLYTIYALKVSYVGNIGAIFLVEFLLTLVAVNMGIFFSSFAANELQVIQFIPVVITPQALLGGIVMPVEEMPKFFQWLSQVMPLTYANRALKLIMIKGFSPADVAGEIAFLVGFALLMVILSAMTIRRRIA